GSWLRSPPAPSWPSRPAHHPGSCQRQSKRRPTSSTPCIRHREWWPSNWASASPKPTSGFGRPPSGAAFRWPTLPTRSSAEGFALTPPTATRDDVTTQQPYHGFDMAREALLARAMVQLADSLV